MGNPNSSTSISPPLIWVPKTATMAPVTKIWLAMMFPVNLILPESSSNKYPSFSLAYLSLGGFGTTPCYSKRENDEIFKFNKKVQRNLLKGNQWRKKKEIVDLLGEFIQDAGFERAVNIDCSNNEALLSKLYIKHFVNILDSYH